jgi:hypothetical protein
MAELPLLDYFVIGEAVGIVATLFVSFYYSKKQMEKLSIDIESKILNDLDYKLHNMTEMAIARPELGEMLDRNAGDQSPKETYAMYVIHIFAYAFRMRQRGILRDNEWNGWLKAKRAAFEEGTIGEYWKASDPEKWFDPEFQEFIDNEIVRQDKLKGANVVK